MMLNATGPQAMAYGSGGGYNFGFPEGVSVTDFVPDHIKHMVHPHWEKFPPVNPMWHYLLGVVYLFLGAISLFGESLMLSAVVCVYRCMGMMMSPVSTTPLLTLLFFPCLTRQWNGALVVHEDQEPKNSCQLPRSQPCVQRHLHDALTVPLLRLQLLQWRRLDVQSVLL